MRCRACNCVLTDFEATRKTNLTHEYVDLCNRCYIPVEGQQVVERYDLLTVEDGEDNEQYDS